MLYQAKFHPMLVGGSSASAATYSDLSYIGATESGTNTVLGVSIGAADANRVNIIGVTTDNTGAVPGQLQVNSGSFYSALVSAHSGAGDENACALYAVSIPSGTTADFSVDQALNSTFMVWRVLMSSTGAHDTASGTQTSSTTSHPYTGVIMPANGFGIAIQSSGKTAGSVTIDQSFVERVDVLSPYDHHYFGADLESVAGFGSSTVTITTGTSSRSAGCIATFKGDGT